MMSEAKDRARGNGVVGVVWVDPFGLDSIEFLEGDRKRSLGVEI